jgi:hypothetical protein
VAYEIVLARLAEHFKALECGPAKRISPWARSSTPANTRA